MGIVISILVGLAAVLVFWRYRSGLSSERKLVLARLQEEESGRGSVLPTEALFREAASSPSAPPSTPLPRTPPLPQRHSVERPSADPAGSAGSASPDAPSAVGAALTVDEPAPDVPDGDVATLFRGVQMPCGLVPYAGRPLTRSTATFVTEVDVPTVRGAVSAELERIGMRVEWRNSATALVERESARGMVTIHTRSDAGSEIRFTDMGPGDCLVELSAL